MSDQAETLRSHTGRRRDRSPETDLISSVLDSAQVAFISLDPDGTVADLNHEAERILGYGREELTGRDLATTIIPDRYRAEYAGAVDQVRSAGAPAAIGPRRELNARHRDGYEIPVELTLSCAGPAESGQLAGVRAFLHDVSEHKLAERVLLASQSVTQAMAGATGSQEAMAALLAALGQSMGWQVGAYWDVGPAGLVRRATWSAAGFDAGEFERVGGERRLSVGASLPGRAVSAGEPVWLADVSGEASFARAAAARRAGLRAGIAVPVRRQEQIVGVIEFLTTETRIADRLIGESLVSVGRQAGELLGILDDRQTLLSSLERLALTDQLTGLPNRRAWEEGLDRELARAARDGHDLIVAVIDLDEFKRYNDSHGHQAGDALLAQTADAWRARVRASDLLARYGGEEFAAVIPAWPLTAAVTVVDRLRTAVPAGQTCSAGVASWDRSESASALFGRADAALYAAKQAGRDRVVVAS